MEMKLVRFHAQWSGPCKTLDRSIQGMDFGVPIESVDITRHMGYAERYGVKRIPCIILLEGEKEVDRVQGQIPPRLITDMVKKHV